MRSSMAILPVDERTIQRMTVKCNPRVLKKRDMKEERVDHLCFDRS